MKRLRTGAIHLVLILHVTSSVSAEDTAQLQSKYLNTPPKAIDFDVSDPLEANQKHREISNVPKQVSQTDSEDPIRVLLRICQRLEPGRRGACIVNGEK